MMNKNVLKRFVKVVITVVLSPIIITGMMVDIFMSPFWYVLRGGIELFITDFMFGVIDRIEDEL